MTVARLRHDIDSGKTGEKSPGFDLAVAPLGTDEEAAGTPVPPWLAEQVRAAEIKPRGETMSRQTATATAADLTPSGPKPVNVAATVRWFVMGVVLGGLLVACLWGLLAL